jgi:hypothetical protein
MENQNTIGRRIHPGSGETLTAVKGSFLTSFLSPMSGLSRHWGYPAVMVMLVSLSTFAWAKWEKEQVALENQLTQRIESILSKTLSPNSYLVTVKVEMEENATGGSVQRRTSTTGGENPFLKKDRFVLPGVPEKKQFNSTPEVTESNTIVSGGSVEALVKKISISVLLAPDTPAERIRYLREFISSAIPFNPLRGDEMEISPSPLIKPLNPVAAAKAGSAEPEVGVVKSGSFDKMFANSNVPGVMLLMVVIVSVLGFAAFLFGPVRGFFNRLLAVLPRVGEQAIYAANSSNSSAASAGPTSAEVLTAISRNGHSNGDSGPKLNMPFQFIREDQLSKLALLFRELSSTECALVLAYLPPAWASRLLANFDAATQAAITRELSRSRGVAPEVIKQVETQIREKLPYMVGGMEWIQAVFPLSQPQAQRVLLNTLAQESPELAKSLRAKTFFFEDLATLAPAGLRALVQEMGYPQMALALKDEKPEIQTAVLSRLPAGIREIVQQELDLSTSEGTGRAEAKNRLVMVARKLVNDGRITLNAEK